jgi:DNA-binding IclR family transcriptional regulator
VEDGHVTPGFASVAAPVLDHGDRPVAAISVTFRHDCPGDGDGDRDCGQDWPDLAAEVQDAVAELSGRIGGHGRAATGLR